MQSERLNTAGTRVPAARVRCGLSVLVLLTAVLSAAEPQGTPQPVQQPETAAVPADGEQTGVTAGGAGSQEPLPGTIGWTDKRGERIPLDLPFKDEAGRSVLLSDYIGDDKPVVLTLSYSDCPKLCSMQLDGVVRALKQIDWVPGKEYRIVSISINPYEQYNRAHATKMRYAEALEKPGAVDGWQFLIGKEKNIRQLAAAVGYNYKFDPLTKEYLHPAGIVVLTPTGRISRYLYGADYDVQTLRYTLIEASGNKIGTALEQIVLLCLSYDDVKGRYATEVMLVMRLGGAVTVVILALWLGGTWFRDWRRSRAQAEEKKKQGKAQAGVA